MASLPRNFRGRTPPRPFSGAITKQHGEAALPIDKWVARVKETPMRINLAAVTVHLAHCRAIPRIGRHLGITFTASGVPEVVAVPNAR